MTIGCTLCMPFAKAFSSNTAFFAPRHPFFNKFRSNDEEAVRDRTSFHSRRRKNSLRTEIGRGDARASFAWRTGITSD